MFNFNTIEEMQLEVFRQVNTFEASFLTMLLNFKYKVKMISMILYILAFIILIYKLLWMIRDPNQYVLIQNIPLVAPLLILALSIDLYHKFIYSHKMATQYLESKIHIVYSIIHKYIKYESLSKEDIKHIVECDLFPYANIDLKEDMNK